MKLDVNEIEPGDILMVTGFDAPHDADFTRALLGMIDERLGPLGLKAILFGGGEFDVSILRAATMPSRLDVTQMGDAAPRYLHESPDLADDALARP